MRKFSGKLTNDSRCLQDRWFPHIRKKIALETDNYIIYETMSKHKKCMGNEGRGKADR